ncbi:unnamed protein product [Brassicogethes aeneus]|uniref:Motile sperm domain-containing protein 2 n=1 Tax=Brassicogethes aeneus TaxID=1431903 RepID=A0A9P0ASJ6_BRAAE|nr:unnamed protein product [Brassicogethes aeneus]
MEISTNQIEDLRKAFLEELNDKGEDSIHPKDLDRIKTSNHWLERFLKHNEGNQKQTIGMMWECLKWRKDFNTNEISEDNIKKEILVQGGFFPHGKDKDGCTIFVFKCIKHKKGVNDLDEIKRCVIYWFERLEREKHGNPISIFFDMEGCGLGNMDMDLTKYLIGLFKTYYPFFLNYILIFEMPWVLSAAFKIIKSWLPEKAIEKIKFLSKKDIFTYVPEDQALTCWGGSDPYQFSFIPEEKSTVKDVPIINNNNKKVHFVDGTSMSESAASSGDKENDGGALKVQPNNVITFIKEGSELISTLSIENTDLSTSISYKLKTTSPEKFRVKPSTGILSPRAKTTVTVTLVTGYHIGGLSKDKFLIMSTVLDASETSKDISDIWKNTSNRKVNQIRLRCVQSGDITRNGNVDSVNGFADLDHDTLGKLTASVAKLNSCQGELHRAVKKTQYYQLATAFLVLFLAIVLGYVIKSDIRQISNNSYCTAPSAP